jgi:hypothetical protein
MSDEILQAVLSTYGVVKDIQAEKWSQLYRYPVANTIRMTMITITKHIPPILLLPLGSWRVMVAMGRVISYKRVRCDRDHKTQSQSTPQSWADMAAQRMEDIPEARGEEEGIAPQSQQRALLGPGYEQSAPIQTEKRTCPVEDTTQEDITMQSERCRIGPQPRQVHHVPGLELDALTNE